MRTPRVLPVAILASVVAFSGCLADDAVDGSIEELAPCPGAHTMAGLDVSVWQGHIDWHRVAASKSFAIARAAYGTSVDSTFAYNYRSMRTEGMIRGSYQFFVPTEDGTAQADVLLRQIGTLGPGDLPPMLDVETDPSHAYPSVSVTTARIHAWKARIEARTGRHPLVYTGAYFWPSHVTASADFAQMGLVIPNWGATCPTIMAPWHDWVMHQTTSSGSVPGISGRVDLDVFKGDRTALESLAGIHHCTPHCTGSTIVEADCTTRSCGSANLCSTAGGVAPRCESNLCVMSASEVPTAHTTCIDDTHLAHCDRTGSLTRETCASGTTCMDDGTHASCLAPVAPDAGMPARDAGAGSPDAGLSPPPMGDGGYSAAPIDYPSMAAGSAYPPHSTMITGGCSVTGSGGPAPATAWLVALGLAALVVRRRTRR